MDMMIRLTEEQRMRWGVNHHICCIYMIQNTLNGLMYIGQTTDLRKRISSYHTAICNCDLVGSLVVQSIRFFGEENFEVSIVEECSPNDLNRLEELYIAKYGAVNPSIGYNIMKKSSVDVAESNYQKSLSHLGLTASSDSKRKRSNAVIAISESEKKFIIADSGKLLGDYLGTSKDMIKNCLRNPSAYKGWSLFYDNPYKRDAIYKKMCRKNNRRSKLYMSYSELLDEFEYEGVETIYLFVTTNIGELIYLNYDFIDKETNKPHELKIEKDSGSFLYYRNPDTGESVEFLGVGRA